MVGTSSSNLERSSAFPNLPNWRVPTFSTLAKVHMLPDGTILLINLESARDRLAFMHDQFRRQGLVDERVVAVDGTTLRGVPQHGRMTQTELACYLSHTKVWRALLASTSMYALVVEDDAIIPDGLKDLIGMTVSILPTRWDLVHLYGNDGRAHRPLAAVGSGRKLVRYARAPAGAVAYLISRQGAEKLLRYSQSPSWPIDTDLRRPWAFGLDSYGIAPQPFAHSGYFSSQLGGKRARGRRGITLNPLHSPTGVLWNIRKLGIVWWSRCLVLNGCRRLSLALLGAFRLRSGA